MKTQRIHTPIKAAELINKGEVVAFPTETVYGLGADAFNEEAVRNIFKIKGRPGDNPLIVHVARLEDIKRIAKEIPGKAMALIDAFFPGPITLVLKKRDEIPDIVTAGLTTVGVRMPRDPIASAFLSACNNPVAAPSANLSGRPSPTTSEETLRDLEGKVPAILTGSRSNVGIESTVIDLTVESPQILRPGHITKEEVEAVIGPVGTAGVINRSPGTRHTHYKPDAKVILLKGDIKSKLTPGSVLFTTLSKPEDFEGDTIDLGKGPAEWEHNLFLALREAEKRYDTIYIEFFDIDESNRGVADRMLRASGGEIR